MPYRRRRWSTRITPEHRKDIERRRDGDIDFIIFGVAIIASLGLVWLCLSAWNL